MLEKVIEQVRALNEPNPCKLKASYEPHQHTSDEVFMGDVGDMEGMSLTDAIGGIVADIAEFKTEVQDALEDKADKVHNHEISDVYGLEEALQNRSSIHNEDDSVGVRCDEHSITVEITTDEGGAEVEIGLEEAINLDNAIKTPDSTPTEDSERLITSGGVYGGLGGKFDKSDIKTAASFPTSDTKVLSEKAVVNYIDNAIQPGGVINLGNLQPSNPLNIDVEFPDPIEGFHYGRLLFFTNNLGDAASALNELLVSSDEGREIHFHLNAADLQKRCNMIRIFKFAPDPDDPTRFEYFVEVAGAWDFE